MRLQEKSVLVTGVGPGLGRESALLFGENGAQVAVTDIADADDDDQAVAGYRRDSFVRPLHGMPPTFFGSTADRVTDRSSEETREGTPIRRGCRSS